MKRFYILFLVAMVSCTGNSLQQDTKTISLQKVIPGKESSVIQIKNDSLHNSNATTISNLEIPRLNPGEYVISHTGYSLSYNEPNEQANWVAYELTSEETNSLFKRGNKFVIDPQVTTGSADDADYNRSGYDRGHLAPAADMGWSEATMKESFYYSNMSPQVPSFNRGIWKRVEELVRNWAVEYKSLYIVTGPVLASGMPTIGHDKVAFPKYFYKVIPDYNAPSIKGIGFIFPNSASSEQLQRFAVSIDSVEKFTGIDFFPVLLAHPAFAGHGLNLQFGGNIIIWFGINWSLELYQQANARLHRQGQSKPVSVYHLITENTIDEDVIKSLTSKSIGQESLMTSIKARLA